VRVACGKVFEREPLEHSEEYQAFVQQLASQQLSDEHLKKLRQDKTRELLRMPKNRSCPDGYHLSHHSQLGDDKSGRRKSHTEVVVNKNFQVSRRIESRTARGRPCLIRSAGRARCFSRPCTSTLPRIGTARHATCFCSFVTRRAVQYGATWHTCKTLWRCLLEAVVYVFSPPGLQPVARERGRRRGFAV
jgi:hypothetical protein